MWPRTYFLPGGNILKINSNVCVSASLSVAQWNTVGYNHSSDDHYVDMVLLQLTQLHVATPMEQKISKTGE